MKHFVKILALLLAIVLCFTSCNTEPPEITLPDGYYENQNGGGNEINPDGGINPDGSIDTPIVDADDLPGSGNEGGSNEGGSNEGGSENEGGSNEGGSNEGGSNEGGSNEGGSNEGGSEGEGETPVEPEFEKPALTKPALDLTKIPKYDGSASYYVISDAPYFTPNQLTTVSYEHYSDRDALGRCGIAVACLGRDLMPTEGRGSISSVIPTGWQTYTNENGGTENFYERAHLIAFQLTGENANWENLISGTYDLNSTMQEFEDQISAYIKETGNHVMYRVTPIFEGNNLLASGVHLEAYSVEDEGAAISHNVYIYNAQRDYVLDYATGEFELSEDALIRNATYVINKRNGKFHETTCSSVLDMSESNKEYTTKTREELIEEGYTPCGGCKP